MAEDLMFDILPMSDEDFAVRGQVESEPILYFVQNTETTAIIIGFSKCIQQCLINLQAVNHAELKVLARVRDLTQSTEDDIHAGYGEHRIRGEWFQPHQLIMDLVEMALAGDNAGIKSEAVYRAKRARGISVRKDSKRGPAPASELPIGRHDPSLYIVQNTETKKIMIGFSNRIRKCINNIQVGNHAAIERLALVPCSHMAEKEIHARNKPSNIRGKWYRPDQSIIDLVKMAQSGNLLDVQELTIRRDGKNIAFSMA